MPLAPFTGMAATVSISAHALSPTCFRRPRVPGSMLGPANVTRYCVNFLLDLQGFPSRRKADAERLLCSLHSLRRLGLRLLPPVEAAGVPSPPLDLTEDNINQVLDDARVELAQLFDSSVGITGEVELADLDGPFVKISLRGRFWHKRSTVLARVGNYLKQRIPEILEVDIEDEKQLDDSPENF
ncbi:hypothetical protein MLD38_016011 [Melastoma candidum]|uniref:Uncharacterized protein n=1 Tax=Melastoma candidum TaxID=119954 RepID=A0ACB9RRH5_9MYRT|nr:hypothetical protein MLD38_016011 [Melastoma candidum]